MKNKDIFTTSEAAKICRISKQKIVNLFDEGQIDGFRIPGPSPSSAQARRIPRQSLLHFMKKHGIPTDRLPQTKTKILIVEDDPASLELLLEIFTGYDDEFDVTTAITGSEACIQIGSVDPDLILLDLMLPDLDGSNIFQSIKNMQGLSDTKVVVVTALSDETVKKSMLNDGVDAYITKPINVKMLRNTVLEVLERSTS